MAKTHAPKKPKRQRKCSHCRQPGHTKRSCRFLKAGIEIPAARATKSLDESTPIESLAVLHSHEVVDTSWISPHQVDLKPKQIITPEWKAVEAYKPTPAPKHIRVTVNFAEAVKAANIPTPAFKPAKAPSKIASFAKQTKKTKIRTMPRLKEHELTWRERLDRTAERMAAPFVAMFQLRKIAYTAIALFLIVGAPFPALSYYQDLKNDSSLVIAESTNAFLNLRSSIGSAFAADISGAEQSLSNALASFSHAESIIEEEHQIVQYFGALVPRVDSGKHLLAAGHHMAIANTYVIKGLREAQYSSALLTDRMKQFRNHLDPAAVQYRFAYQELEQVDPSAVPEEYRETFLQFRSLFAVFLDDVEDIVSLVNTFESIFGGDGLKRYLIMNQNVHEQRPTGGFMGSYLRLDVQRGRVLTIDTPEDGIYGVSGQSNLHLIPPGPMQLITSRAEIQDANWYPDASASARNIERFYEDAFGMTVDGTIFVNSTLLEDILEFTGPIEVDGVTYTAEHVLEQIRTDIETKKEEIDETLLTEVLDDVIEPEAPKQIIGSLLDGVLERLNTIDTLDIVRFLGRIQSAGEEKEFMGSFLDPRVQLAVREHGVSGEIIQGERGQDYLFVVGTNIGGGKSDARMVQSVEHQAEILPDGRVINTVTIRRTHTGNPNEPYYGDFNINYLRLYVPEGATLVESGGFTHPDEANFQAIPTHLKQDPMLAEIEQNERFEKETGTRITEEFGKTVFGNWVTTAPGKTTEVFFQYILPFKVMGQNLEEATDNPSRWKQLFVKEDDIISSYKLLIQKQSGTDDLVTSRIIYPSGWYPVWKSEDDMRLARNGGELERTVDTDMLIGIIMKKQAE